MNKTFSILFNNDVLFHFMDEETTIVDDVYEETTVKVYHSPIPIVAKIVTDFKKDEIPEMTIDIDAVVTVPTQQLIEKNIPHDTMEDLETLAKGFMSFKQVPYYSIELVRPKVLIDNEWQFYDFFCYVPKGGIDYRVNGVETNG